MHKNFGITTSRTTLSQARTELLTALIRIGAILATGAFLLSLPSFWTVGYYSTLPIYLLVTISLWIMAFGWRPAYTIQGSILIASMYLLGLLELLTFGYSADGHAFLIAGTLFGALFFDRRVAVALLTLATLLLLTIGWLIASNIFVVWAFLFRPIDLMVVLGTASVFVSVAGTLQYLISVLLDHLNTALLHERALRDQLEIRVNERTEALAQAHNQVSSMNNELSDHRTYLVALYNTTLDLLNHHQFNDLLDAIVTRAAQILSTPCSELLLPEGDLLVVKACTPNLSFLLGERVSRDEAKLSWKAYETGQPVTEENYANLPNHRAIYDQLPVYAVLDLPIMIGTTCCGVLSLSRTTAGTPYSSQDIWKGQLFAGLIALVLENAQLYNAAQTEIAQRTQIEQELREMTKILSDHNADLDAFGRTVAHDLKTPLTTIINYVEFLEQAHEKLTSTTIEEDLRKVRIAGIKMSSIIDDLLLLAQAQQMTSITTSALKMQTIVVEAISRLTHQIEETGATLIISQDWPIAIGYAPWIEAVWVNYISNAIKYGGIPPEIRLGVDPPTNGFVCFWVHDNGLGIPKEQQAILFEDFTRFQPERVDGYGLGLSIVRRIIENLGGTVGVESSIGTGSKFFFTLPATSTTYNTLALLPHSNIEH